MLRWCFFKGMNCKKGTFPFSLTNLHEVTLGRRILTTEVAVVSLISLTSDAMQISKPIPWSARMMMKIWGSCCGWSENSEMKKNDRRCVRRSTTRSREPFVLREVSTNLQTLSGLLNVEVRIWDSRWSRSRDAKKFPAVENKLSCRLVEVARRKKKRKEIKKSLTWAMARWCCQAKSCLFQFGSWLPMWILLCQTRFLV